MSQLSSAEQSCISENGDPRQLLMLMRGPGPGSPQDAQELIPCLGDETLLRLFLTGLTGQTEPLSAETSTCVRSGFQDFDIATVPTAMPVPTDAPSETTPESGMPGPTGMNDTGLLTSELSDAELSCLSEIGDPQQLVTLMNSPDLASPQERDAMVGCLEHETLLKLFLNGFTDQTGPLSDDTSACVSAGFQNFDLRAMMLANQEGSRRGSRHGQGHGGNLNHAQLPERRGVAGCQSGPGPAT